jgi:NAD(P)-dependent dehydrogenase (short-subunit alcohol dehydrogenase family)
MFVKGPLCAGTIFTTTVLAFPVKLCFQCQGTADVCMSFRGALEQTKGAIISIGSMNATLALRASRLCQQGGVVMLTRALALSWAPEDIRVSAGRAGSH